MMYFVILLLCLFPLGQCLNERATHFGFSKYYQNHMVLQRGARTSIWGTSSKVGDTVHISINGSDVGHATVDANNIWQVVFTPPHGIGPFTLKATSSLGAVTLSDVLFGDVWVCSGQSNMEFFVDRLINKTEEYKDAANYPNVRLFNLRHKAVNTTLSEISLVSQPWALPSAQSLHYFSALCWLYGKQLSQHLQYPIGLVETNWGGTPIEAWSSPDALSQCPVSSKKRALKDSHKPSWLYDGMIYPLLRTTIKGAIWYQGESNSGRPDVYACQFPAMIKDWRQKFSDASMKTTSANFPFGFVQLAPSRPGDKLVHGFTELRWSQTAKVGFVPNFKMPHTFMAVALDLPDFQSPYGTVHPRYKHDIARRLVLSALAIAYQEKGFDFQGPFPSSYTLNPSNTQLTIEYDHGNTPIQIRSQTGFEIHCSKGAPLGWKNATMTSHSAATVVLDVTGCGVDFVRYAWRMSPCPLYKCAVYGRDSGLPAPPILHRIHQRAV